MFQKFVNKIYLTQIQNKNIFQEYKPIRKIFIPEINFFSKIKKKLLDNIRFTKYYKRYLLTRGAK